MLNLLFTTPSPLSITSEWDESTFQNQYHIALGMDSDKQLRVKLVVTLRFLRGHTNTVQGMNQTGPK